jgi:pseudaminic acid biosynthesis-associated methylase
LKKNKIKGIGEKYMSQEALWTGQFGELYTERNIYDPQGLDQLYMDFFGISRTELNLKFLSKLKSEDNILELGCNVGNQLRLLESMGFSHLYGIELQAYAVEKAKSLTQNMNIIQASAFEVPLRDAYFNMVFTSGVLIHIAPENLDKIMGEMVRLTKKYIWGFEYYAEELTEISYRGNENAMWKGNYAQLFLEKFPNTKLVKKELLKYKNSNNVDMMYIIEVDKSK